MSIDVPPPAAAPAASSASDPLSVDERWAAWQASGAAHDRAVRRKMAFAAPAVILVAVVLYLLLGR